MIPSPSLSSISGNRFLHEICAAEVTAGQVCTVSDDPLVQHTLAEVVRSQSPRLCRKAALVTEDDQRALQSENGGPSSTGSHSATVLGIPVFDGESLKSVVAFSVRPDQTKADATGVFEIWTPQGVYQELGLSDGHFGELDRFQNVSSFVRFEKGRGLPGQAWASGRAVIHDNLPNHPGFLRAAGASAESLECAIAFPVFTNRFLGSVVLISSDQSPMFRGMEVWNRRDAKLELSAAAYLKQDAEQLAIARGSVVALDEGLAGLAAKQRQAVLTTEAELLHLGRPSPPGTQSPLRGGLALPCFRSSELTCVTLMLF